MRKINQKKYTRDQINNLKNTQENEELKNINKSFEIVKNIYNEFNNIGSNIEETKKEVSGPLSISISIAPNENTPNKETKTFTAKIN